MDRRHGKRPLPSEASEDKEKHQELPSYESSWSETDMSAMVSALTQVIGTTDDQSNMVQSNPSTVSSDLPQPAQDQGILYNSHTFPYNYTLTFHWHSEIYTCANTVASNRI